MSPRCYQLTSHRQRVNSRSFFIFPFPTSLLSPTFLGEIAVAQRENLIIFLLVYKTIGIYSLSYMKNKMENGKILNTEFINRQESNMWSDQ